MPQKNLYQRYVDKQPRYNTGAGEILTESETIAAPSVTAAGAPTGLTVGDIVIARSASTPFCYVNISWSDPPNEYIIHYLIEYSKSSSFTNPIRVSTTANSAAISCDTSSTYYIRIAAQYPNVLSSWTSYVTAVTPADLTVPDDVTDLAASFSNGDLYISWTEPTTESFKDARIKIYNVGKSVLYGTYYSGTGQYRWSASTNLALTSGAGVTSVVVQVTSRSWGNIYGNEVETGTITSTAPTTPANVLTTWDADDGTASADCTFSWDAQTLIKDYVITIDSVAYVTGDNKFSYTHSLNKKQHATNTGDYALSYSVVARNNLLQISSAASGTATNAAPADAVAVVAQGFYSTLSASITSLPVIQDLDKIEYKVYNNSVLVSTLTSTLDVISIPVDESGSYEIGAIIYDVFGRYSAEVKSSATTIDAITVAQLRSDVTYTDSLGNDPAALNILKDTRLDGSSISYAASADWRWILCERSTVDRYRTVTISLSASGTTNFYIGYSEDGITYYYYYGTITDGRTQSSNSLDENTAKGSPSSYSSLTSNRVDRDSVVLLPARYIKFGFRNTTNTVEVYEFYPRRLIQSDDIEAETIKAINIGASQVTADHVAADAITADKINVSTLEAISADMGILTAGSIVIGTTNKLWLNDSGDGGLYIGGSTKGSAPFRVSSAGACTATNITITGTIGGTLSFGVSGVISAGGGDCIIDTDGITLDPMGGSGGTGAITWSNASYGGSIYLSDGPGEEAVMSFSTVKAVAGNTKGAFLWKVYGTQYMALRSVATATDSIGLTVDTDVFVRGGELETTNGRILATKNDASNTSSVDCMQLTHRTTGTAAASMGINVRFALEDDAGNDRNAGVIQTSWVNAGTSTYQSQLSLFAYDYGSSRLGMAIRGNGTATQVGFFGATPVVKPTALTATNASTVDTTYGAEEAAVINNTRTRVDEIETKLQALGLLT